MKWMITRMERKFAVVDADTEEQALFLCQAGLIPEDQWQEDARLYEYSNDLGEPFEDGDP